jgi:hypothetical protein
MVNDDDQNQIDDVVADLDGNATEDTMDDASQPLPQPPYEEDEESFAGSAPDPEADDDTHEMVEDVIGNEPVPGKPFSLADEVEKDENERRGISE